MKEMPKADTGARLVAALIDGVLTSVVSTLIPVLGGIASTLYMLLKDGLFDGQSLGKRVMKLQVLDINGKPGDFTVSVKRNVIFAIPTALLIIPILGWIAAPFVGLAVLIIEVIKVLNDPKGIRLGDQWAGSQVVMLDDVENAEPVLFSGPSAGEESPGEDPEDV